MSELLTIQTDVINSVMDEYLHELVIVIFKVLHMMVGRNISDEQLGGIADRAISDADLDKDGVISFEELKRVSEYLMIYLQSFPAGQKWYTTLCTQHVVST